MTTFSSHGITQVEYTIWWYRGDEPGQETTMYAPLHLDYEELKEMAMSTIRRQYGSYAARGAEIQNIAIEYNREAMAEEIRETIKSLDRYKDYYCDDSNPYMLFFYDQDDDRLEDAKEVFDVSEAVENVICHYEETGDMTTEIRYDGLKNFTQEVIF